MKTVSFTLTQQIIDSLNKISDKTGLKKSDIIRRAIEDYLRKIENEKRS